MAQYFIQSSEVKARSGDPCPAIVDGLNIWVIADDAGLRTAIGRVMNQCGAKVQEFHAGDVFSLHPDLDGPDAVLVDMATNRQLINLILQRVSVLEKAGQNPVARIALFRPSNFNERLSALGYGFSHRVPIPPDPKELLVVLRAAVESGRLARSG
jgi:DNA-binding response OmpR family regulator